MYKNKRILAVIPARGGSKGIPKKNLKKVHGKSLIQITCECVKKTKYIDHCVISSDSEEILLEGEKFGIKTKFKRPQYLSGDNVSDIPVLIHALKSSEKVYGIFFDVILMLQPTAPNRTSNMIEKVVKKIINENLNTVWTIHEVDSKYHPDKQLIKNKEGNLEYFTERGKSIVSRQELGKSYMKNGNVYALEKTQLLRRKAILGKKNGFILQRGPIINIDNYQDLILAKNIIKKS